MKKTVLITAGAKRIGAKLVRHFAFKHYNVIFTYNNSEAKAQQLMNDFANIKAYRLDLNDESAIRTFWENLDDKVDILINNAAVFEKDSVGNLNYDRLNRHITVNLIAPTLMIDGLNKQKHCKTCVINLLDKWSDSHPCNFLSYSLSKNSLNNLTKYLIKNSKHNERIFGIELGFTLYNHKFPKKFFDENKDLYPSSINALLSAIDFIISDDNIHNRIIDLTTCEFSS